MSCPARPASCTVRTVKGTRNSGHRPRSIPMLRFSACASFVLLLTLNVALCDTYKGKVKSVDTDAKKLVVTVDDKEMTFDVPKDVKIFSVGKAKKGQTPPEIALSGLSALGPGNEVTVTTAKKDDKDVATGIR